MTHSCKAALARDQWFFFGFPIFSVCLRGLILPGDTPSEHRGEIARAVFEQHNEAKRENDEQSEPKKARAEAPCKKH